jgi:uncharacterized protein with HEPN domain
MAKTPIIYVNDILSAIRRVQTYTKGMSRAEFGSDELRQDAVIRCLEVISEASRRLSEATKTRHPDIPWAKIAAIGNILRHEYQSVSADLIWNVAETNIPDLRRAVEQIKAELDEERGRVTKS